MIALTDIRRWDHSAVEEVFVALGDVSRDLQEIEDRAAAARTSPEMWHGLTADVARAGHDAIVARLRALRTGVDAARVRLADAADAVVDLRTRLDDMDALAAASGFAIGSDGSVTDVRQTVVSAARAGEYRAERDAVQSRLADGLGLLLARATDVDNELLTGLTRATAVHIAAAGSPPTTVAGLGTPMSLAPPPVDVRTPVPLLVPSDRGFTPAPVLGPLVTVPAPVGPDLVGTPAAPGLGLDRVFSGEPQAEPPFPPPPEITGRTLHGEQQIQSRDGHGVNDEAVETAVTSPITPPEYVPDRYGGRYEYIGPDAFVSLNAAGEVVTAWARTSAGWRHP
jgi:hypothetical protein